MKRTIKRAVNKIAPGAVDAIKQIRHNTKQLDQLIAQVGALDYKVDEVVKHDSRIDELKRKIAKIEPYQPTYHISGIIDNPMRSSRDRCVAIESALAPVAGLRILDIGSSLGYVCYYFADRGAKTTGWEMSVDNAEVSRLIGEINGIPTTIKTELFDIETVKNIQPNTYDVVTILSVLHHIVYHQGLNSTKVLMKELLDRVPVVVVELAKKGEDKTLFWNDSLPDDELEIFDLVKSEVDIKHIGDFPNHLSQNPRPLYVISRKQNLKVNGRTYAYERVSSEAYPYSPAAYGNERRNYYWSDGVVIKEYIFEEGRTAVNSELIINELSALFKTKRVYNSPNLIDYELNDDGAKIVLERIQGELLADMKMYSAKDIKQIVADVLHSLSDLERLGLFHNDVRSWNIIYNGDKAYLLDYGQVSTNNYDNDLIALMWVIETLHNGGRESTQMSKQSLPDDSRLPEFAVALNHEIAKGEKSPQRLLNIVAKSRLAKTKSSSKK